MKMLKPKNHPHRIAKELLEETRFDSPFADRKLNDYCHKITKSLVRSGQIDPDYAQIVCQ